jgi:alkylation response protein AidB-like acyl-CoA dehydrogenase
MGVEEIQRARPAMAAAPDCNKIYRWQGLTALRGFGTLAAVPEDFIQVVENGEVRLKDGKVQGLYCLVPVEQAEIIDTWHVRGMRGTGTHHFAVNDVFVPAERTVLSANPPPLIDGPLYKLPRTMTFAIGDAAVALGVARSCINAFFELAGAKTPHSVPRLLREQAMVQFTVGQAEAALRCGRAFFITY